MRRLTLALLVLIFLNSALQAQDTFKLTLLHTNDTHAHHLPTNGNGGAAIQGGVVDQIRAEGGNVLLLDMGDRFSGTLFHTLYQGADQVQVMTALGYDGMVLGNHEFDQGDTTLAAFINAINFPIVVANIDVSQSPELKDIVKPYAILDVNGAKIGLIGLMLAETPSISSPSGGITFSDDYATIANQYAQELTDQGINKIVLMAHIGYDTDIALLSQLKNIDVVLGGNSDFVFSNTYQGAHDPYPVVAEDADGNAIYYAQAGSNNTYMGRMDVEFDAEGVVTRASGDAILLSRYIAPDPAVANIVDQLASGVKELEQTSIGAQTNIVLDGKREICRAEECRLGDVIADAMRATTGAQIALMNGGGIRASLDVGDITVGEVMAIHPFGNTITTLGIDGANLRLALENSVSRITLTADGQLSRDNLAGRFLQVSGLRYSYDPRKDVGSRIVMAEVDNGDGTYSPLMDAKFYSVVTNNFVSNGGDGYSMFKENGIDVQSDGRYDYEVLTDYLVGYTPIDQNLLPTEPRITVILNG